MKRKEFLQRAATLSGAALLAGHTPLPAAPGPGPARGGRALGVLASIPRDSLDGFKQAVKEAALAATDFGWLSRGDTVFIKPVINSGNPYPATTNPHAVAAITELLKSKGAARVVVGDMSGVESVRFSADSLKGSTRANMQSAGFADIVSAAGAEVQCFEEAGWSAFYEDAPAFGTSWTRPLWMPAVLKQAQHIVLMPRCARHVIAGSTLGMKAAVGYWRHDTRLEYHRDAATLHEKTAEGNFVTTLQKKQRLILTTADKMLLSMGPDDGHIHEPQTGLVIASPSIVAHDMLSLAWLLANRNENPSVRDGVMDNSHTFARVANHVVTSWLGGLGAAAVSETVKKPQMTTLWQDLVLAHAFRVAGGVPEILVATANDVPENVRKSLEAMVCHGQSC